MRTKPDVEAFRVDENDKAVVDFVQHSLKKDSRGEAIREALKRYAKICGYRAKDKADLESRCIRCAKEHNVECPALEKGERS